jgi:hypothetical protein
MAAGQLTPEEGSPIRVVAETASKKIEKAIALLSEYRESGPVPAAPGAKPKSPAARTKRKGK